MTIWCVFFFRDPARVVPDGDNLVVSLRGTNREGTFPPGFILDKLYYRVEREIDR